MSWIRGCAILLPALLLLVQNASARRRALLVGDNYGGPGVDSLRFAETDAKHFADVLTRLAGFEPEDVQLLTNADSMGLENALAGMRKNGKPTAGQDDLFLFYYSGHSDRDALRLGNTRYPLERLRETFQAVPSQIKIGIFDACQSGMMTRFKGGSTAKPISLENLKNVYGQVIIASSAMDERSQESDQLEGSVFTHHWLNGLRGSADMSGDRKVTLNEAYQYAYQMTIETTSKTREGIQHPAYQFRIYGEGDIVLADLTQGKSGLVFPYRQDGKYLVVDKERGRILADFYKGPDREMLISLPEGSYNILKVEKDQWRVADVKVVQDQVTEFNTASLKRQAQVVNQIKGGMDNYKVIPGPPTVYYPTGPSRRFGVSLKSGEGAGILGLALLYNLDPELQIQGGMGLPAYGSGLNTLGNQNILEGSYFGLLRKYESVYFVDGGLNVKTTRLTVSDSSGAARNTGWELGIPVHFGLEIGPRKSVFGSLSIGYLWMISGGGHVVSARTPHGTFNYTHTQESGPSFGLAFGMYLF